MIKNSSILHSDALGIYLQYNDNHIFGEIIEIYHACKWYLPKNTGFETRQIPSPIGSGNLSSPVSIKSAEGSII